MPHVIELPKAIDAVGAFQRLAPRAHCLFLDSALAHPKLGRYSFVCADPFLTIAASDAEEGAAALVTLTQQMANYESPTIAGLPPFQGGAAGLLGYDLNRSLERVAAPRYDDLHTPALHIGLYDVVLAFDHVEQRGWLISQGWPEADATSRDARAQSRAEEVLTQLNAPPLTSWTSPASTSTAEILAPQFPTGRLDGLTSNFSRDAYLAAVRRAVEYIYAGDIFQVNLAQRLLYPAASDSLSLYLRLRERNPATFAGYYDLGAFQIVSASPERFVSLKDRQLEARPIKGTRQRSARPEADLYAGDDLQQSEKDRAENVMIVDLLRNDLARVCTPESVVVTDLCRLEVYQYVQHLVSVVRGELAPSSTPVDVIRAAFPGGSITGAPKVRAMEIISELEPTARGPYCGSLGYWGFDAAMDWSILIRTITAGGGYWQMPVGGGIVAQSDPAREYDETWHKALGMLRSLQ